MPARIMQLDIEGLVRGYVAGLSAESLATKFHVGRSTVLNRLKDAGVRIRRATELREKALHLDADETLKFLELIDGLLLGDASLSKQGSLRMEQTPSRLGWLRGIRHELAALGVGARIINIHRESRAIKGRPLKEWHGYLLYTSHYAELKDQRVRWYPDDRKQVPEDVQMSPKVAREWISGDGTGTRDGGLVLCTQGFSRREVLYLTQRLHVVFNVRPIVTKTGTIGLYRKDDVLRLRNIVKLPRCCAYKFRFARRAQKKGKLSPQAVRHIRSQYGRGVKLAAIAVQYDLSRSAVNNIGLKKVYRWVV